MPCVSKHRGQGVLEAGGRRPPNIYAAAETTG